MSEGTVALSIESVSRATDGAYLAAVDVASIAQGMSAGYRIVGGNAVTLLTAIHGADQLAPSRETADADFGCDYSVVADARLPAALLMKGYTQAAGNRFCRSVADHVGDLIVAIDILAPSYGSKMKPNQSHGNLVVDEVPGLSLALSRPPIRVSLHATLTSGTLVSGVMDLPDLISALCLKAYAYVGRYSPRDALDIWRLLAAANEAGLTSQDWPRGASAREAAALLRRHFGTPSALGPRNATSSRMEQAHIRALVAQIIPATTG